MTTIECSHIPQDQKPLPNSVEGCVDCLAAGRRDWVHLRICQDCDHVGCCDNSPGRHATGHFHESAHPLIRSLEPDEDWWACYVDDAVFVIEGTEVTYFVEEGSEDSSSPNT